MVDQLRELWRRFQSHALTERLLFVAIPVAVAILIILGAVMLADTTVENAISASQPAGPAEDPPATPTEEPVSVAGASATPNPSPTAIAEAPPSPTAVPAVASPGPSPASLPTRQPAGPPRVRVVNTDGQGANLRSEPSAASERIKVVREGAELEVVGPDRRVQGDTWRNVEDEEGDAGWILGEFLEDIRSTGPRPTPTPVPLTIQVEEIRSPVQRGAEAELVIATRPGTRCEVRVFLYGPASVPRAGLETKVSDSRGRCAWTWTVPEETVPGTWRYSVIVGTGDRQVTREIPLVVT